MVLRSLHAVAVSTVLVSVPHPSMPSPALLYPPPPDQIKIIDFGAACDLVTGINFNPLYGMLDPRYSPPEELVMPQSEFFWGGLVGGSRCVCGYACLCGLSVWPGTLFRTNWGGGTHRLVAATLTPRPYYAPLTPLRSPPPSYCVTAAAAAAAAFPRAPTPLIAALLSPFAWFYGRPDLFDSYSAGILLMQMSVPQLRSPANIRQFNNQLRSFDQV